MMVHTHQQQVLELVHGMEVFVNGFMNKKNNHLKYLLKFLFKNFHNKIYLNSKRYVHKVHIINNKFHIYKINLNNIRKNYKFK